MKNVRVWFEKKNTARYISHLDLNRCMSRAFQKTKLPLWHTQGFHPHIFLTITMPLSLGMSGLRESMDIRLIEEISNEEIIENKTSGDTIELENQLTEKNGNDIKVETANGTDKFITILQSGGIEFIDNSGTSNIIWVLYKKDAQAIVEQAAAALGFSCKLYKRGSMATSNRPAWMILIH